MYAQISPGERRKYPLDEFTDAYDKAQRDGDGLRGRRRRGLGVGRRRTSGGDHAGELRHRRLRPDLRIDQAAARRRPGGVVAEPGLSGPGPGRAPRPPHAGARSGRRSWPATERPSPRARRPHAPRRSARRRRRPWARSPPPAPSRSQELARAGFPPGAPTGTSGLELAFNRRLAGQPGGAAGEPRRSRAPRPLRRAGSWRAPSPFPARPCTPPSIPTSSRPRRPRSAASTAAWPCSTPGTARCWRSPGSPSPARNRRARPSS